MKANFSKIEPRMVVYKFRSLKTKQDQKNFFDILQNHRLFAAKFTDLNDPTEGYFSYYCPELANAVHKDKLQLRICSFSRYYSNALLWSYYSDGHKGACVAVSLPEKLCHSIRYSRYIPQFEEWDNKSSKELAKYALTNKLDYWSHELETRWLGSHTELEDGKYISVKIEGVLMGENIDPRLESQLKDKCEDLKIQCDKVRLERESYLCPCTKISTNLRPANLPHRGWLSDGAGPLAGWGHPSEKCQLCGLPEVVPAIERTYQSPGFLENHYIIPPIEGGLLVPANTALLCPNCHRKEHINAANTETLKELNLGNSS